MAENKKSLLAEFSRKAMQRLQDKKAHKKQVLHVPGLEQDITIRSLTYNEIAECNEIDDSTDRGRSDKYGVYLAMVEPDLKAAAKEIMEAEADLPPLNLLTMFPNYERGDFNMMNYADVPIWEKYTLTIEEAAKYFRIGENKLRKPAEENPAAGWVIMNGNRIQIKRKQFEKIIDTLDVI